MLRVKLILERFDREHRLLERREQASRSFVQRFIGMLYIAHAQTLYSAPYAMTDITGTSQNTDSQSNATTEGRSGKCTLAIGAPPGNTLGIYSGGGRGSYDVAVRPDYHGKLGNTMGIQVGTGSTAVTPTDYALATRIAHGRSAGQLEYGGCELINITFSNPNGEFTIRRYFTNNSGGAITVNEVGIYSTASYATATTYDIVSIFLIARDLVSPGVTVNNTELLRVTYVVQITV